jgi:DNA (cytosine-5)-methyltransferase 1
VTFGSLFSGIGGMDLGLERAGMVCRWQCEIDPYARRVLAKHWPEVVRCGDIRDLDDRLERVDLIAGGFPCQPVSLAGKRRGRDDERWLWPELARVLRLLRPRFVLVENVPGLLARGMGDVLGDLACLGYDAEWQALPAAAFGAPHLRYRVWIVAYAADDEQTGQPVSVAWGSVPAVACGDGTNGSLADASGLRCGQGRQPEAAAARRPPGGSPLGPHADREWELQPQGVFPQKWRRACDGSWWAVEPPVGRVAHGVPRRVDRLRGLGNACVPQVVEWIGRRILAAAGEETDA